MNWRSEGGAAVAICLARAMASRLRPSRIRMLTRSTSGTRLGLAGGGGLGGGGRGGGDLFGKCDGIEITSVTYQDADAIDIGDEAWIGCRLSRRRRWHGGGQAGQNADGTDPPSDQSSEGELHGLTVSRKARSFPGGRLTRLRMSAERGSFRS